MKRHSTSYVFKEVKIKTMMRCHYTSIKMAKIKPKQQQQNKLKICNTNCWKGCRLIGTHIYCYKYYKMALPSWKIVSQILTKLNVVLPCDSAIVLLSTYPMELKIIVCVCVCVSSKRTLVANLFLIFRNWKQTI